MTFREKVINEWLREEEITHGRSIIKDDIYDEILQRLVFLKQNPDTKKTVRDFALKRRFDLISFKKPPGEDIFKLHKPGTDQRVLPLKEAFDVLHEAHIRLQHASRDIIFKDLSQTVANIINKHIQAFVNLCSTCQLEKRR